MTRQEFAELINNKLVFLDGATGSNLQKEGMDPGVCPEKWILEHEDVIVALQKEYVKAGSDIIYAPTFTANKIKLDEYGLADDIGSINKSLVDLSKRAIKEANEELVKEGKAERKCYIAGDITMTGKQLYPIGSLKLEQLIDIYKEQLSYLYEAGVDLIVVETMMSLSECRAAVLAVKETSELPVMVTLSFEDDMRTLYGTDPATAVTVLQSMGVDAIGANCSSGASDMKKIIDVMTEVAQIPIIAKPNLGVPVLVNGKTAYSNTPEEYASEMKELILSGARIIGGCCGTDPSCIRFLRKEVDKLSYDDIKDKICEKVIKASKKKILTSERCSVDIASGKKFMIIGERINPTGKKALQASLREADMDMVINMAEEQEKYGADILDVNVGMNGIDEKEILLKAVEELSQSVNLPLSIDTSNVSAMECALRNYPGRALINSISLSENTDKLLDICKKYGAMFVLLPLSESGLPKDIDEKKNIIHNIIDMAKNHEISKDNIVVDGLVATVGADKNAAIETLETIRYCKEELGVETVCGLSNISYGLPERIYVNSAFVALAISKGLTMAIANPMQELLMNTIFATDLLMAKEDADSRYVERMTENVSVQDKQEVELSEKVISNIYDSVLKGRKEHITEYVQKELDNGCLASDIIDNELIPAINRVGDLFASGRYFLPQLMKSADAMKEALDYIEPYLDKNTTDNKGKIVIATVKGDIHDIGKNLVSIMLKNYGFEIYDLGKNVEADDIVNAAVEYDADIIGLSALMTTTMMEMKNVVDLARNREVRAKIMIGGAVVTEDFAYEIGADGYSADANDAVAVAKRLISQE
ncbi:MAG: 5-methyltetrahydrofolate--homocysteine methyltransferase [Lachnospiraceae bacterium]|nr:5-methyltetrahydrofolate--homocysteine methyltransferase [Lachnospiraceae bacterium]